MPHTHTPDYGPIRFAAMAGSSIAAHDAAPWVTDFLNAAYYRRAAAAVDDLRLAFCVLTTHWWRKRDDQGARLRRPSTTSSPLRGSGRLRHPGRRRLHVTDLPAFHRAFGADRVATRGTLSRDALLAGGDRLLGDWFSEAYADDARRGWGIAFPTVEERDAYDPERRLALARLGELTPEHAPLDEQVWHTYEPVAMPSAEGVIDVLTRPETWPDFASEIGRFTPLRDGGLLGQTFEIEVAAGTMSSRPARPVFTRGYVTVTTLVTPDDPHQLARWFAALAEGLARYGDREPRAVPDGATPLVGFDLTTHQGHFMGSGHNRVLLYVHDGQAYVRAAGTWDPMPWHVDRAYHTAGKDAQHAFWGPGDPTSPRSEARLSLLHQLAEYVAARG